MGQPPAGEGTHGGRPVAQSGWNAAALDVVGPGERHRRGAGASTRRDRGRLWTEAGSLFFAGERGSWAIPLSWFSQPETDLAGVTRLRIHTADRGTEVTLRLQRAADDETGLAQAIRLAHTQDPDPRDRAALEDLLRLVRGELSQLQEESGAEPYPARVQAAADRLQATWMPYWGDAASRLREATLGVLTATAEASAADADEDAEARHERAVRRWQSVCEDLSEWCGVPVQGAMPAAPPVRRAAGAAPAVAPLPATVSEHEPVAPTAPPAAAVVEPEAVVAAAPPPEAAPEAPVAPEPEAAPEPAPAPPSEPEAAAEVEEPDEGTLIIRADQLPTYTPPAQPAAAPPAPTPTPRSASPEEESESTLIFSRYRSPETPPAPTSEPRDYEDATVLSPRATAPPPAAAPQAAPAPQAPPASAASAPEPEPQEAPQPVVSGPGRKGSGGMTMLYRRGGAGSMASIARKELEPEAAAQPDVERIFLDIGRRFGTVQHPNFVHILGSGKDLQTRSAYIDMEFVEGESIGARQRRGPLPPRQALDVVDQIAAAIDAIHQVGLVHGDVRPQNVLIEPAGRVVLLEPSLAVDHELEHRRGTIYGELPYLTLERVRGEPDLPASDIYALGTMAFALLAGRPPWDGEPAIIFTGHEEEQPPPLDQFLPGAPSQASAVIGIALAKRPAERPRTASEFARALRQAFNAGTDATEVGMASVTPPGGRPSGIVVPPAGSVGSSLGPQAPRPGSEPPAAPARPAMPGPLGRSAPSPLGPRTPPPPDDEEPPDDIDRTIIVRPK